VTLDNGKLKQIKNAPPTFFIGGGTLCTVHKAGCPDDNCQYVTNNKKVLLRSRLNKAAEKVSENI
jgi:hypothetical protein